MRDQPPTSVLAADEDVAGEVARRPPDPRTPAARCDRCSGSCSARRRCRSAAQRVVDADVELVDVVVEDAVRDEVVVEEAGAGNVGQRISVERAATPDGSKHERLTVLFTASTQPAGTNGFAAPPCAGQLAEVAVPSCAPSARSPSATARARSGSPGSRRRRTSGRGRSGRPTCRRRSC